MLKALLTMKTIAAIVSLFVAVSSLRQQIVMYEKATPEDQGNVYTFQNNTPSIPFSLAGIQRVCTTGFFLYFIGENYSSQYWFSYGVEECEDYDVFGRAKSFRYVGASETDEDAVSLYAGTFFTGQEIFVGRSPYAGISTKINSLGVSGNSAWTLFEGPNFDGNSACLPAPTTSYKVDSRYAVLLPNTTLNVVTVGSLFKGCAAAYSTEFLDEVRKQWRAGSVIS